MTPLEIIATIFVVFVLVTVCIVVINPQVWMKVAGPILKNYILTSVVYFILAGIIGYYIFVRLEIAEVAAVMLFTALLIGLGLLPFGLDRRYPYRGTDGALPGDSSRVALLD